MTRDALHKRLAILGALIGVGFFLSANAHLIVAAFRSQSACVVATPDKPAARPGC